jgi:subtilisin family serine protease
MLSGMNPIAPTNTTPIFHPNAASSSPGVQKFSMFVPKTPLEVAQGWAARFHHQEPQSMIVAQFSRQADLSKIADMPRTADRRTAAWEKLVATAKKSQAPLDAKLSKWKQDGLVTDFHGYALGNTLEITVPTAKADEVVKQLQAAAKFKLFERIDASETGAPAPPAKKKDPSISEQTLLKHENDGPKDDQQFIEKGKDAWQLWQMGVRDLQAKGLNGKGVVVGILDTGVDADHPNLRHAWRGNDGSDPSLSWLPKTDSDLEKHKVPIDDDVHGTHVAGLIAGREDRIHTGVAPESKFIIGSMFGDSIIRDFDWFLAPGKGDYTATSRDATKGADIVSNSWGMVGADGEKYAKALALPLKQLSQAGVIPVFAAGNSGPGFNTVNSPGTEQSVITVASTDRDGTVSGYSSRDNARRATSRLKPDIAAPGNGIPSSVPDGKVSDELAMVGMMDQMSGGALRKLQPNYPMPGTGGDHWLLSGTSMATPLVSGSIALMLQKYPTLDTEDIKSILHKTAIDMGKTGPDAMYGYGRIDLPKALQEAGRLVRGRNAEAREAKKAAAAKS